MKTIRWTVAEHTTYILCMGSEVCLLGRNCLTSLEVFHWGEVFARRRPAARSLARHVPASRLQ